MIKYKELAHFDSCLNKAKMDEMIFVLREVDAAAPFAIRVWAQERIRLGLNKKDDEKIIEALVCADFMEEAQKQK